MGYVKYTTWKRDWFVYLYKTSDPSSRTIYRWGVTYSTHVNGKSAICLGALYGRKSHPVESLIWDYRTRLAQSAIKLDEVR